MPPHHKKAKRPRAKQRLYIRHRAAKLGRFVIPAGFIVLWISGAIAIYHDSRQLVERTEEDISHNIQIETQAMADKIGGILTRTHVTIRTISLLPAVRAAAAKNRENDTQDVVELGLLPSHDANTIQQLYNHISSDVDISEIYLVYDGFNPGRGQVPFLMYDQVLLERIENSKAAEPTSDSDRPEEYEEAEYEEYVRQLAYLKQHYSFLPDEAPKGIAQVSSSLLRTCDNSQYTSIAKGDERNTYGILFSVPIYDQPRNAFKGLVTAVMRANVLEAALIGWPTLPVTVADNLVLAQSSIDLDAPAAEYVLTNSETGVQIMDRRNQDLPGYVTGEAKAGLHLVKEVTLSHSQAWQLHRYTSQAYIDAAAEPIYTDMWQRLLILSLLIAVLLIAAEWVLFVQRRSTKMLTEMANFDSLTGLPNRRLVAETLTNALKKQAAQGGKYAVLMIDLDDFKEVNDTLGHHAGDKLLVEISQRASHSLRASDQLIRIKAQEPDDTEGDLRLTVGRLGGDEFLVLVPSIPDDEHAFLVADRLHQSFSAPVYLEQDKIYVHASIGIALYPDHGTSASQLLRNADTAMYLAKRQGTGKTVLYAKHIDDKSQQRLLLLTDLHSALSDDQFVLHYQPELNRASGIVDCVEALLRWQHPTRGLLYPGDFIDLLEQSGMIVEVGQWVLSSACQQLKQWQDNGSPIQHMCVNVSIKQLTQPDFEKELLSTLTETEINADSLSLELTETMLMQQPEANILLLKKLRKTGVKIALDDFGTCYSSLSYLRQLPLDTLKIDRSFVIDTQTTPGLAICETLSVLAKRLGLTVIAEGIETTEQFSQMSEIKCDWLQGYLISRPLPPNLADEFARSFKWGRFLDKNTIKLKPSTLKRTGSRSVQDCTTER
uniref:putative bifunctional diguanylate cyclase/phosphodiesterase n=1 Tax=Marinobacterium profundum TaxID=1714300 RepID=UPI00082F544C|nr:EAL domain-containing protein [Marinobacterium profundum]